MTNRFLNIGCGSKKLPGFINMDIVEGADLRHDVRQRLPFRNNTIDGIFSEHLIEHLTQAEGVAFLRECRRVLVNGGRLRVATPDLDLVVRIYQSENWKTESPVWAQHGYNWLDNRAEQINLAMREWGHRWLYNEEELVRLSKLAGLELAGRYNFGESNEPNFRGLEYREGTGLHCEFVKARPPITNDDPLVSVIIAAYNHRYFREALESALNQSYRNIEIIVGDDSVQESIGAIIRDYPDDRIKYYKNARNLGSRQNMINIINWAAGKYIKCLNDDDRLQPTCVERMLRCLQQHPDVTLVTSHRQPINAQGALLGDLKATLRPVCWDSYLDGVSLVRRMVEGKTNFIGEQTTTMFRKADLVKAKPDIFSFAGREYQCLGDMVMWTNLLSQGDGIYLMDTLSYFRIHGEQEQANPLVQQQALVAHDQLLFDTKRMGFMCDGSHAKLLGKAINAARGRITSPVDANNPATDDGAPSSVAPAVSIIIPVFNRLDLTEQCLDTISMNTPPGSYELIIIDNGSQDGTKIFLTQLENRAIIIANKENLGFAKASNQGARMASAPYLLFLNNDTEPQPGWLQPMLDLIINDDTIGAVGSKLIFPDQTIQHAGVIIFKDNRIIPETLGATHVHYQKPLDFQEVNEMRTFKVLTAACLLVRRNVFEEAGGFDEGYWNGFEDVDLCLKIYSRGWKLVYQPQSLLIHHESKSGPERFSKIQANVNRLQERWLNQIKPDFIVNRDGSVSRFDQQGIQLYSKKDLNIERSKAVLRMNGVCHSGNPTREKPGRLGKSLDDQFIKRHDNSQNNFLVSLIIPAKDNWEYTRLCLDSLVRNSDVPFELVIVDNGSEVPFRDRLDKWRRIQKGIKLKYVRSNNNLGFAGGVNLGLQVAMGNFIIILNNDTVVTPGLFSALLRPLAEGKKAGITGPVSNFVAGEQMITIPGLDFPEPRKVNMDKIIRAAKRINRQFSGVVTPTKKLIGLCLAMKRETLSALGGFDERFFPGNFEDVDYSIRAIRKGYTLLICREAFLYHFGHRTFRKEPADFQEVMRTNLMVFMEKWGLREFNNENDLHEVPIARPQVPGESLYYPISQEQRSFIYQPDGPGFMQKALKVYEDSPFMWPSRLIIPSNGGDPEELEQKIKILMEKKGLPDNGEIIIYSGKIDEILAGLEGSRCLISSWNSGVEPGTRPDDITLVI